MRLFLFLALVSFSTFAQLDTGDGHDGACDENTNYGTGVEIECLTLNIAGALANPLGTTPIIIRVQGAATIGAAGTFNLNGANGTPTLNTDGDAIGGAGGPGAGPGGGINTFASTDAQDPTYPASDSNGDTPLFNASFCAGGGGGGFALAGAAGALCTPPAAFAGVAGLAVDGAEFAFTDLLFRGGFGGGAGGESGTGEFGKGGGGGGAIRIVAGGDISITANITAVGGKGGNTATINTGGGGGAGSGGAIWLQSEGNITIAGILNADGGVNDNQTNADGVGGDGGQGHIRLEDADGIITVTGTVPGYADRISLNPATSTTTSLKSDIACGTIGDDDSMGPGMFIGFAGSLYLIGAFRILSRYRRKRAKKFVPQHSARTLG